MTSKAANGRVTVTCIISHHSPFCRAPDGTCLLVCSADCKMRLYNLPSELYSGPSDHQLPDMVSRSTATR